MSNPIVCVLDTDDPRAAAAEASLDAAGFPLPLFSRMAWATSRNPEAHRMVVATGTAGKTLAAIGLEWTRTRTLPGHGVIRVHACEDAYATETGRALLQGVVEHAVSHGRVLDVVVELECRSPVARQFLREALRSLNFRQRPAVRIPSRTIALDLSASEEAIFSSFSESTRTKVRKAARLGLELDALRDPRFDDRMNGLLADTFARTGERAETMDWPAIMTVCAAVPSRSHLVGLFDGPSREPENLVAYAWGIHNGKRAIYHTGASARVPGLKVPLMYTPMWELIRWAKREGASWFDFGGISQGNPETGDMLGGITEFKRRFCRDEIDLGEEWVFEPNHTKAAVARLLASAARRFHRHQATVGDR